MCALCGKMLWKPFSLIDKLSFFLEGIFLSMQQYYFISMEILQLHDQLENDFFFLECLNKAASFIKKTLEKKFW